MKFLTSMKTGEQGATESDGHAPSSILESLRQMWFPAEFRIAPPNLLLDIGTKVQTVAPLDPVVQPEEQLPTPPDSSRSDQLVAEFATCLWYLKTKHFKQAWDDTETANDDPRVRRALIRLNKSIDALKAGGFEVQDPTNKRYPPGSEGTMQPIQLLPTAGLTFDMVSETVAPIIYRDDRLIQRGQVFVAVPQEKPAVTSAAAASPSSTEKLK
ncbi:MAG: hypothetical protein HYZ50_20080 [Deltaproteobacteria bacterium]|nr:hypothetical protein [Deltaproteobacteria bacterium]